MGVFDPVQYDERQRTAHDAVVKKAKALYGKIDSLCVDSRETSIAKTKLQECVMWANRSIAQNGSNVR